MIYREIPKKQSYGAQCLDVGIENSIVHHTSTIWHFNFSLHELIIKCEQIQKIKRIRRNIERNSHVEHIDIKHGNAQCISF